jgi:GNAT superfamily N-acetyltransferase
MIRAYRPDDVAAVADLLAELEPEEGRSSAKGLTHWIESQPERAALRIWLLEEDGRLGGLAYAGSNWTSSAGDTAWLWAGVAERLRGRGAGVGLFDRAEAHAMSLRPRAIDTWAFEGTGGEAFARARGFEPTRRELVQRLDPREADLTELEPLTERLAADGFQAVPLREAREDEAGLHVLYVSVMKDVPADEPEDYLPFPEFVRHVLGDPELDPDASTIVLHDGRPVALALLRVIAEFAYAESEMTGTLPEFRGRGLARLAKLRVLRAARDLGLTELVTENDSENAPILAVNRRLGYRATQTRLGLVRATLAE